MYCMGISLEDHMRNEEITAEAEVMPNKDLMRRKRMQWYGLGRQRESEDDIWRV